MPPPGVPQEQQLFVVPVQQLQHQHHPYQMQEEQELGQNQHELGLQPEFQQAQAGQQRQQQLLLQQQQDEMETLQPVRFDSFTPLPIREILVMFKTPSGLIKKMPPRPQSGTVWRYDDKGNNKDNWKAQLYQWAEPGEKNSDSFAFVYCSTIVAVKKNVAVQCNAMQCRWSKAADERGSFEEDFQYSDQGSQQQKRGQKVSYHVLIVGHHLVIITIIIIMISSIILTRNPTIVIIVF